MIYYKIYEQSITQIRQNQLSQPETGIQELNREKCGERIIPNSEDSIKFGNDIWSIRNEHNQHTEWLKDCRKQFENVNSKDKVGISQEMVKMQWRKMTNWKAPGKDGVQGCYVIEKPYIIASTYSSAAKSYP